MNVKNIYRLLLTMEKVDINNLDIATMKQKSGIPCKGLSF